MAELCRVARRGLRVAGAKRGAERCFFIVTDERQSLQPAPPAPKGLRRHRAICHVATPHRWESIGVVVAPRIWPDGARNATLQSSATGC